MILVYVYEMGKKHPVAVVFPSGYMISLDPWDVEEISQFGRWEYLWKGVQK